MDREKIILYSEKTENLGEPELFLGRGEAREPGCGDVLAMFVDTRREIITECRFTITECDGVIPSIAAISFTFIPSI